MINGLDAVPQAEYDGYGVEKPSPAQLAAARAYVEANRDKTPPSCVSAMSTGCIELEWRDLPGRISIMVEITEESAEVMLGFPKTGNGPNNYDFAFFSEVLRHIQPSENLKN